MYFPTRVKRPQEEEKEDREPARILDRWHSWVLVHFPSRDLTTWVDISREEYQPLSSAEAAWRLDELNRTN